MFDIGWTELMVVGIVALIVVGPKDLPKMFRTLGQFTAKARAMAREFQRAMDDAADASGVKDVARDLRNATDTKGMGLDELNKMRKWDPLKDKTRAPDPKTTPSDEDKAATARISAEMEKLRKERAAQNDGTGTAASADTSPPEQDAAVETDKSKA